MICHIQACSEPCVNFSAEMLASEQPESVNISDAHRTQYKIVDLKPETEYIVSVHAVTIEDGKKVFVMNTTGILAGLLMPLTHSRSYVGYFQQWRRMCGAYTVSFLCAKDFQKLCINFDKIFSVSSLWLWEND